MWILAALLACASPAPDSPADTATDADPTDTALPDSGDTAGRDTAVTTLNGTVPAEAIAAPEFVATNLDGTSRSRPDLIGHPTVLWFYPKAATGG